MGTEFWMMLSNALVVISLVAFIFAGIKTVPSIIKKIRKKQYSFDIDYKDICFLFISQNNRKIVRLCLFVYYIHILNKSGKPNTLKNMMLAYRYNGKMYHTEANNIPTKIEPRSGEPFVTLGNGIDIINVKPWYNIRQKLGMGETLQPGAVFHGSATFMFDARVLDAHSIKNLCIIVRDFNGNESVHPLVIKDEWFVSLHAGFMIKNE